MRSRATIEEALDHLDGVKEHCTNWAYNVMMADFEEARQYAEWFITTFDIDDPVSHRTAFPQWEDTIK